MNIMVVISITNNFLVRERYPKWSDNNPRYKIESRHRSLIFAIYCVFHTRKTAWVGLRPHRLGSRPIKIKTPKQVYLAIFILAVRKNVI